MTQRLHIIADENIPGLEALLADVADIEYLPGRQMQSAQLTKADALLVRSITAVNAELLTNTKLGFVGSCTIGTDHIDLPLLQQRGIEFANAPGCNADAVVDYVLSALLAINPSLEHWQQSQGVIVGFGEVGSRLFARLQGLGINALISDPFKAENNATEQDFSDADWISLHVPLTKNQEHATDNLFNAKRLASLKPKALLINSGRGKVVDNQALLALIKQGKLQAVLDVYQDEPSPSDELLNILNIATGHIAGYSLQGKLRGSLMVASKLRQHFTLPAVSAEILLQTAEDFILAANSTAAEAVHKAYDIAADSARFKTQVLGLDNSAKALAFDAYRKHYPVRHELGFLQLPKSVGAQRFYDLGFASGSDN